MNATLVNDDKFYTGTAPGTKMEDGTKDGKKLEDWKGAAGKWNDYNKGTAVEGGFSQLDPNVRIVVARPFIEHSMHNVIMAVAGRDTGPVGRSNSDATHEPCPDRPPSNHRRRHALRPGGHATLS